MMGSDSTALQLLPPGTAPARDENGDLLMFWIDAHEVRVNGGQHLYLFGNVPVNTVDSGICDAAAPIVAMHATHPRVRSNTFITGFTDSMHSTPTTITCLFRTRTT